MSETQPADPAARRIALAIVGCAAIVGVVLITIATRFSPELQAWIEEDVRGRLMLVIAGLAVITAAPALALAIHLWRLGSRVIRAERYPPRGLRLTRDTPVLTGPAARRHGKAIKILASVLGLAALLLVFFLWRLTSVLIA